MTTPAFDVLAGLEGREVQSQEFSGHVLADIDGDRRPEIVVVGSSASGPPNAEGKPEYRAEVRIMDYRSDLEPPQQLVQRHRQLWDAGNLEQGPANHYSVFAADTDGDGRLEIITGGSAVFASRITRAQLRVLGWDSQRNRLLVKNQLAWTPPPFGNAQVERVWAADVDNDGQMEIVCGGTAWHGHTEGNSAWIAVFSHRLDELKGYRTWPFFEGSFGYLADLAVGNIDAAPGLELVTLSGTMSSPSPSSARSIDSELIAWRFQSDDSGLMLSQLDAVNWSGPRGWARPKTLWLGDLDQERGVEIVTGGARRLTQPWETSVATDVRFWRFAGGRFVRHMNFDGFIFTDENDIPLHLSDCRSISAADIDGDGKQELLLVCDMAGTNGVPGGFIMAVDPNVDLATAPQADVFKRTKTYEVIWHDGTDAHLWNDSISSADLAGDGATRTVVSGTFTRYPESRGVVFVFS